MTRKPDVVVIGAGFIGLWSAYFLAQRGLTVTVVERDLPGSGSSTRGGGGVRAQWGTPTNVALSVLSRPWFDEFEERFGTDLRFRPIGYCFLATTAAELDQLRAQVAVQHEFGVPSELLTPEEITARWPTLDSVELAGASFCATDGFLSQHRLLSGVLQAAIRARVRVESGVEVIGLARRGDRISGVRSLIGDIETEVVVNAAGASAPAVGASLGIPLPIRGRRVSLMLAYPDPPLPPDLPWLIEPVRQVHIRQDLDGRAQVGGFLGQEETVDPASFDHDARGAWIDEVLAAIAERLRITVPRASVSSAWAGLYPTTPDQHPIIDRTNDGLVIVGGFAGAGLMHSPAAGMLAAELIADGRLSSIDPAPVSLARFSDVSIPIERTGF